MRAKMAMEKSETILHEKHHQELLHFLMFCRNDYENWLRQNTDPAIKIARSPFKHPILGRGLKFDMQHKIRKLKEEEMI
jgi:hypothetical protein